MKIEHIALYVNDLEGARKFFLKYLVAQSNYGYHNPRTNFRSYFLSFDDGARLVQIKTGNEVAKIWYAPDMRILLSVWEVPNSADCSELTDIENGVAGRR